MVLVLAQQDKQVHAMIRHAQGHIWECDLGVVGDEEGEAGSVGDRCCRVARVIARPSWVLVPRHSSSTITSERAVAHARMLLVSLSSCTIKSCTIIHTAYTTNRLLTQISQ